MSLKVNMSHEKRQTKGELYIQLLFFFELLFVGQLPPTSFYEGLTDCQASFVIKDRSDLLIFIYDAFIKMLIYQYIPFHEYRRSCDIVSDG